MASPRPTTKDFMMNGLRVEKARYDKWRKAWLKKKLRDPDYNWADWVRAALDDKAKRA